MVGEVWWRLDECWVEVGWRTEREDLAFVGLKNAGSDRTAIRKKKTTGWVVNR